MNRFLLCFGLLLLSFGRGAAQPAIPAQPADPNQARPALPVAPDAVTPPATNNAPPAPAPAAQVAVTIIADSSLKQVLQELAQSWADTQDSGPQAASGPQVPLTLTNAGTLRAKVESASSNSAWDVVISADVRDVKEMTDKGLLAADGQRSLARNTLVIYGRKALVKDDDLDWFDLIGTEWNKVALGNPDLVASGRVAKRALQKHDLLGDEHKDLYVYAPTDALALAVAEREEADAVFAYKTDAAKMNLPGFAVFSLNTDDAPPVFYTAAICRLAKNPAQARAFIDYCAGEAAKAVWAKYGFETN
ncbi:MAG TPA: molybdate ABC transporter substrate-binding protein [Candidatus Methylacidiphilales bacterium]|jgi:molybdate transport system substrate-binding protein|nr:molybdate ABC transporter substrate-binding protein [Candidatus Methylacidiphilales bacterium]